MGQGISRVWPDWQLVLILLFAAVVSSWPDWHDAPHTPTPGTDEACQVGRGGISENSSQNRDWCRSSSGRPCLNRIFVALTLSPVVAYVCRLSSGCKTASSGCARHSCPAHPNCERRTPGALRVRSPSQLAGAPPCLGICPVIRCGAVF